MTQKERLLSKMGLEQAVLEGLRKEMETASSVELIALIQKESDQIELIAILQRQIFALR